MLTLTARRRRARGARLLERRLGDEYNVLAPLMTIAARRSWSPRLAFVAALATASACTLRYETERLRLASDVPEHAQSPTSFGFLKVHGKGGEVTVLERWQLHDEARRIEGTGAAYDDERRLVASGPQSIPYDDVVLVETNRPKRVTNSGLIVMGVTTASVGSAALICSVSPKMCFGSCPTFYRADDPRGPILAEGFSASIARALEATDVDTLQGWRQDGGVARLTMRNEALETHVVRTVDMLAVPTPPDATIVRAGDGFWTTRDVRTATKCRGEIGDCLELVRTSDDRAYQSETDPKDLATTERLEVELPRVAGRLAIVVRARNTLLNTFLFYQTLAFLGPEAGARMAALDGASTDDPIVRRLKRYGELLGDIRISVRSRAGRWLDVGTYREVGPLAWEEEAIPVPDDVARRLPDGPLRVRLELTQGYWRLDRLALVGLDARVTAARLAPVAVRVDGRDEAQVLATLVDPSATLVTYPGDAYELVFEVPDGPHTMFVVSRGYYYEWMRQEWMREHDPAAARQLLLHPRRAMRRLAPAYKAVEAEADAVFWRSRVR